MIVQPAKPRPAKDADTIKSDYPLASVMAEYGVQISDLATAKTMVKCPFHEDSTPSMTVDVAANWFNCHGCGKGGDVINFVALKENCTNLEAMIKLGGAMTEPDSNGETEDAVEPARKPAKPARGRVVATYIYRDESGTELFRKLRYENKDFIQGVMHGDKFVAGLNGARRVLYNLPSLLKSTHPIWVVEGEKDADNLTAIGLTATTNPEGGGKWKPEYTESLSNRDIILCGDNDDIGRKHVKLVQEQVSPTCRTLRHVTIPDPHKDASDLIQSLPLTSDAASKFVELADLSKVIVDNSAHQLPEIESAVDLTENQIPMPLELVSGLLHQGTKFALGGGSKTCKTWVLLDLAISIAAGVQWLGSDTIKSKVLFVNLEIPKAFFRKRIIKICKEKGIPVPPNLDVWNLRGFDARAEVLLPKITERIKQRGYAAVILDPIYKTYGDMKENAAEDMSRLMNHFERVAVQSNVAIGFAAHFSKGNQAAKDSIDRISGSGVFARDPDTIMTMTALETEGTFAFDATLRNLKPFKAFAVKWHHPLMVRDDELDPTKLKKPGGKPKGYDESKVAALLDKSNLSTTDWQKVSSNELGVSRSSFFRCVKELESLKIVSKSIVDNRWMLNPKADLSPSSGD